MGELDVVVRILMPVRSMRSGSPYPYSKAFASEMLVDGFEPWSALDQDDRSLNQTVVLRRRLAEISSLIENINGISLD